MSGRESGRIKQIHLPATDKYYPFFRLLKKAFYWDEDCDKAFQELKDYLGHLPLINQPKQSEALYLVY